MAVHPDIARRVTESIQKHDPEAQLKAIAGLISKLTVRQMNRLVAVLKPKLKDGGQVDISNENVVEALLGTADEILDDGPSKITFDASSAREYMEKRFRG